MADSFTVIGQRHESQLQPDGTRMAVVVVKYQTKTDPPTVGEVSVPAALLRNPQNYASTVQSEIQTAVDAHNAVANL